MFYPYVLLPDKLARKSEEEKADAAAKFVEISEAYNALIDRYGWKEYKKKKEHEADSEASQTNNEDGWSKRIEQFFDHVWGDAYRYHKPHSGLLEFQVHFRRLVIDFYELFIVTVDSITREDSYIFLSIFNMASIEVMLQMYTDHGLGYRLYGSTCLVLFFVPYTLLLLAKLYRFFQKPPKSLEIIRSGRGIQRKESELWAHMSGVIVELHPSAGEYYRREFENISDAVVNLTIHSFFLYFELLAMISNILISIRWLFVVRFSFNYLFVGSYYFDCHDLSSDEIFYINIGYFSSVICKNSQDRGNLSFEDSGGTFLSLSSVFYHFFVIFLYLLFAYSVLLRAFRAKSAMSMLRRIYTWVRSIDRDHLEHMVNTSVRAKWPMQVTNIYRQFWHFGPPMLTLRRYVDAPWYYKYMSALFPWRSYVELDYTFLHSDMFIVSRAQYVDKPSVYAIKDLMSYDAQTNVLSDKEIVQQEMRLRSSSSASEQDRSNRCDEDTTNSSVVIDKRSVRVRRLASRSRTRSPSSSKAKRKPRKVTVK